MKKYRGKKVLFILVMAALSLAIGQNSLGLVRGATAAGRCSEDRAADEKIIGEIRLEKEYGKEAPLTLTYGTAGIAEPFTLWCDEEEISEESLTGALFLADPAALDVSMDREAKSISFLPGEVSDEPIAVNLRIETRDYHFEKELYVKVKPLPLIIEAGSVAVSAPGRGEYTHRKVYDGGDKVDVKATLRAAEDLALTNTVAEEIRRYFTEVIFGSYASGKTDVRGENEAQTFTFAPGDLSLCTGIGDAAFRKNYTIENGAAEVVSLVIEKRLLPLAVADSSRAYRSLAYTKPIQTLVRAEATEGDCGFVGTDPAGLEDFSFPQVVDTTALGLTEENVKTKDTAAYGIHEEALMLDTATGNAGQNYVFDLQGYTGGTLTVAEEEEVEEYITVDITGGRNVWQTVKKGETVRYFGPDAWFSFILGGGYNRIYTADGTDITDKGIAGLKADISGMAELSVYLTREEGGVVRAKTTVCPLSFVYDGDVPDCSKMGFGKKNKVVSDLAAPVTFGVYDNKPVVVDVAFEDDGAGVKAWSYCIAAVNQDVAYEELLQSAVFQDGPVDNRICVGALSNTQRLKKCGNYVVLVKVSDHVGNTGFYGSDGVVLEDFRDISVSYTEKKVDGGGPGGIWNGVAYYSGNAGLTLTARENADENRYYSGIEKIVYTVSRHYGNGERLEEREEVVVWDEENGDEDGWAKPVYPENVTLAQLKKYCTRTKTREFADDPHKSQVITVSATARDHAGNVSENPSRYTLVLDSLSPIVRSSCAQANNHGEFLNGIYANSEVTYAVAVEERFLRSVKVAVNGKSYTLAELEAQKDRLGIASVTKDADRDIAKTTDSTVYHFRITFTGDGAYTVGTTAVDAAGNSGRDMPSRFVIDTVRPRMEVVYTACQKDGTREELDLSQGRVYVGEAVSYVAITVRMTEQNFEPKKARLSVKAADGRNRAVRTVDYATAILKGWKEKRPSGDSQGPHVYDLILPALQVDANYEFLYGCTDLAGNEMEPLPAHALTLDRVKPEGAVIVEGLVNGPARAVWENLPRKITFDRFGGSRVKVAMTDDDDTSGIAAVWYLTSSTPLSRGSLEKRTDWTVYEKKRSFYADRRLIVYGKIADRAGNIRYIGTNGILLDKGVPAPSVKLAPVAPRWGKGVYGTKDQPGFRVVVTDPSARGVYAGIKKVTYKVVNGTTGYVETGVLAQPKKTAHKRKWTGHVRVDTARFHSNDVRVTVSAEDWSGNVAASREIRFKVDSQAPVIRFSFDKNDARGGTYYRNDKKLTITVKERNFDASYMPKVTSSSGGGYKIGSWTHRGETHTAVVTFTGDGDYTVSYSCYDQAGNRSNTERLEVFTVDKTPPKIRVSYDNNAVLNGIYYRKARTATVTVIEHNFDPAQITAKITSSAGAAPKLSGWSHSGDTHRAKLQFTRDADYTFRVSAIDRAGNRADDYRQGKYTLDRTSPRISISGVKDKSANNKTVAPEIRIRDANFAAESTEVTLTGVNRGEQDLKEMARISTENTGMTVKFKNFAGNMDDIYTLACRSVDKAGNESETAVRFSVNRDGSVYEIGGETQKLLAQGYVQRPQDIVVTEINADQLKQIELSYSLDGKIVLLREGEDYTVEKSGGERQWKKYVYRIRGTCFSEEGAYVVNLYSEDAADNAATNKSKAKELAFTVDKTAPTMAVSNLIDGGRYREEAHSFTLHTKDNLTLAYVEMYLDGERIHRYEGDELEMADGELVLTVGNSRRYQTVELLACDKAGNISRTVYDPRTRKRIPASYRVLVTADSLVQLLNNRLFLGGFAGLIAVIAFLLFWRIGKGSRKEKISP